MRHFFKFNGFLSSTRLLLALLTIVGAYHGALLVRDGVHINTDLKSLSPAITHDQVVNQTLDDMSRIAAGQFTLVLTHPDAEQLEQANDALREQIEDHDTVLRYVDRTAVLKDYVDQVSAVPFGFLDASAQTALQSHADEQLLQAALARLFGSSGNLRLVPLQRDPFGFANDFALDAVSVLGGESTEDLSLETIAGESVFYTAHNLMLMSNALDMGSQALTLTTIKRVESDIQQQHPGTQFLHSGIFFFAADAAQSSKKDISLITTGSALGVLLLVLLIFRSFKALLLPVISILSGTLFAFIICQAIFGSLHIFTLIFGASLIGVVIDYSLHFFYFHKHQANQSDVQLQRALTLSLFTSVIGYSALSWSGLDALRQVALFSGLGLVFAWLMVVVLGPLLAQRITIHDRWLNVAVLHTLKIFTKVKTTVWLAGIALACIVLLLLGNFQFVADDSPRALFSPNPQLVQQEQTVNKLVNSNEPGSFLLVRGENARQVYDLIEQVQQRLPGESDKLVGVQNFFPSPASFSKAYQLNQRLFGSDGLALAFMRDQGFSAQAVAALKDQYALGEPSWLTPAAFFARHQNEIPPLWIEQENTVSTFLLIPKMLDLQQLKTLANEVEGVSYISAMDETTHALGELRHSALWLLLMACVLVALLMLLRFRSLRLSLVLLSVPAGALALTLLCLSALGAPMTLFHVMALFLVLGLGMDYVIFVTEIEGNAPQTLCAIVLSAATSLLSFGLLAASDLPAVSGFGLTVLIGNSFNLIGSLLLASRKAETVQAIPAAV